MPKGIQQAAERLLEAARTRTPCAPVRDVLPDGSAETAYAVQNILTARSLDDGRRIVGRKVGLTSPAVQRQLGVDRPDFGVLFADMEIADATVADSGRLLQPKVEAEIAFVLAADLDAVDLDAAAVRSATAHVVAALEIVDSRIAGWDITFADTVADNASSALYVLGTEPTDLAGLDLTTVRMELVDGTGATMSEGTGAACLGDPVEAVLWLARTCRDLGAPLRAGEIVLSGALGPMAPAAADGVYTARLSDLGTVSVGFSGTALRPGDRVAPERPLGVSN
ncbi:fumarylacetoacetate hydrolase family protein [Pseudonocardia sp. RS11V-5]|uniref:2-keto-4-pentenoate hydratase n=1 Tax=Pseudonocardia terrae TaxID=2905831 RepID=UPI001E37E061|nr:fumarylacetoacetate hydrolase family protein [Pseudonocardia terrae]MCE3554491.1 fumarylacetoacetate hydrolase family protein [Pseudonocardia terrae]